MSSESIFTDFIASSSLNCSTCGAKAEAWRGLSQKASLMLSSNAWAFPCSRLARAWVYFTMAFQSSSSVKICESCELKESWRGSSSMESFARAWLSA